MPAENADNSLPTNTPVRSGVDWRFIAIVLVITILPFLLFARQLESHIRGWVEAPLSFEATWVLVVGMLWADILLPIPSSVVTTFAGAKLGWFQAFLASDLGMLLAAFTAFGLGRFAATTRIARLTPSQAAVGANSIKNWGPWAIFISRGIPLVAEIVLIYVAAKRIPFWTFLWPTLLANTAISLGYAVLGQWAADREWLAVVLGASGIVPLLVGLFVRRWLAGADSR